MGPLLLLFLMQSLPAPAVNPASLADAGHYLRLKAAMEPLVKANPQDQAQDPEANYWLSQAQGALGELDDALKHAEAAVAAEPKNARYHALVAAACGRLAQASSLLKQLMYARRAKKELDTAIELDPNCEDALYGLTLFYYAAPSLLGGDKQKAQNTADTLTRLNPTRGYLAQAKLANDRKDAGAEEDFYKKVLSADPKNYEAKTKLAKLYLTANPRAAWEQASEALAIDPGQADAYKILAQFYVVVQCWDEVRGTLERARIAVPDDLSPYYFAALAIEEKGRFLRWAPEFLDTYLKAPPEGNEPTVAEAEKAAKRIRSIAGRAARP